jgi:hypothetical protein
MEAVFVGGISRFKRMGGRGLRLGDPGRFGAIIDGCWEKTDENLWT